MGGQRDSSIDLAIVQISYDQVRATPRYIDEPGLFHVHMIGSQSPGKSGIQKRTGSLEQFREMVKEDEQKRKGTAINTPEIMWYPRVVLVAGHGQILAHLPVGDKLVNLGQRHVSTPQLFRRQLPCRHKNEHLISAP
jgi:hypothetical protein